MYQCPVQCKQDQDYLEDKTKVAEALEMVPFTPPWLSISLRHYLCPLWLLSLFLIFHHHKSTFLQPHWWLLQFLSLPGFWTILFISWCETQSAVPFRSIHQAMWPVTMLMKFSFHHHHHMPVTTEFFCHLCQRVSDNTIYVYPTRSTTYTMSEWLIYESLLADQPNQAEIQLHLT